MQLMLMGKYYSVYTRFPFFVNSWFLFCDAWISSLTMHVIFFAIHEFVSLAMHDFFSRWMNFFLLLSINSLPRYMDSLSFNAWPLLMMHDIFCNAWISLPGAWHFSRNAWIFSYEAWISSRNAWHSSECMNILS